MAHYKCVPAPKELTIKSKKDYESAINSFANLINNEAKDGWRFASMENIAVTQKAGCFMALLGQKDATTYFNMLIFEKD